MKLNKNKRFCANLKLLSSCIFNATIFAFLNENAIAQPSNIVPDRTLGNESSIVSPDSSSSQIEMITGGAQRGQNLFHSFREFNVSEGRGVYFYSPNAAVQNILTRITGSNPSEIMGTLGTFGNSQPNLFLMNPNGIIFGRNASLDVGGSFVATTANAVQFGNQGFFSASNPNSPSLLTVKPSAFLFNQIAGKRGSIENNSGAPAGLNPSEQYQIFGLRVPDGQSLLLLGGDVNINSSGLFAYGGRVELGGISREGTVKLNIEDDNLSLSFPDRVSRGDVSLNNSFVDVAAGGGGSIAIAARNFQLAEQSGLSAGIGNGLGSTQAQAGNITIQAAENVTIQTIQEDLSPSFVFNSVAPGGVGNAGDIIINARSLSLTNGSQVGSSTSGEGNAGDLTITTGRLVVRDGGIVSTSTSGQGDGGNLTINAAESVQLFGTRTTSKGEIPSGLSANSSGKGNAGDLTITTGQFVVRDGGIVSTFTEGEGNGGDLTITTRQLLVQDGGIVSITTLGKGNGGNLLVHASESVQLLGTRNTPDGEVGSSLGTFTSGKGIAGNLMLATGRLVVRDGGSISTLTSGKGDGGDLTINATESVQLLGTRTTPDGEVGSYLLTNTSSSGNAGNVTISTGRLFLRDGGSISTLTSGEGNGGNLTINAAESVQLLGTRTTLKGEMPSTLLTNTLSSENAGNVTISTGRLLLRDGGLISTVTESKGNGGNLTINATESVQLLGTSTTSNGKIGSILNTGTSEKSEGDAGDLTIATERLLIRDGGIITTATQGKGEGGDLTITARQLQVRSGSNLFSNTISTSTLGEGNAGDIRLRVQGSVTLTDWSGLFASAGVGSSGKSGRIFLNAKTVTLADNARIAVSSKGSGEGGRIRVTTDSLSLDRGLISAETASTDGGDINLQVNDMLLLRNNSQISTTAGIAGAGGRGGNIDINAKFIGIRCV